MSLWFLKISIKLLMNLDEIGHFAFTLVVGIKHIECSYIYWIAFSLVPFPSSSLDVLIFFNSDTISKSGSSLYSDSILSQKSFTFSKIFFIYFFFFHKALVFRFSFSSFLHHCKYFLKKDIQLLSRDLTTHFWLLDQLENCKGSKDYFFIEFFRINSSFWSMSISKILWFFWNQGFKQSIVNFNSTENISARAEPRLTKLLLLTAWESSF